MSDDALGEHWRPLVDAVDDALLARSQDASLPLHRLGRFEIEELVGFGGMGLVFKARDPRLDRIIALKLWKFEAEDADDALLREATLQAQVSHPNVVTIFEVGKVDDDVYLAMEFVQGMDLRRWMLTHLTSWEIALALMMHAGRGLAAVHARGLVHADFKPENILVCEDGRVLVADFGVARILDERAGRAGAVSSGRGTKAYMAPERLERRQTDERSDQFSFCVTLWESIYGVRPFAGHSAAELLTSMAIGKLQRGEVVDRVPAELEHVLRRGLALEPDARFANMGALLGALVRVPQLMVSWRRTRVALLGMLGSGVFGALLTLVLVGVLKADAVPKESPVAEHDEPSDGINMPQALPDAAAGSAEEPSGVEDTTFELTETADDDEAPGLERALELIDQHEFKLAFDEWQRVYDAQLVADVGVDTEAFIEVAERMLGEAKLQAAAESEVTTASAHEGADHTLKILLAVTSVDAAAPVQDLVVDAAQLFTETAPVPQ